MKKIDRLILGSFIGPFILTTAVVVFILLIQQLMQHVDDLLGKGLSYLVFGELCFYFAMHIVPLALPLAVLLSSLITFGNLGEHFELTALKGAGVSLVRVLRPLFVLVVLVSIGSYFFNDRVVPYANLKAYRLLWDIKQKSPSLSIKEGSFYNGLPGYSIKVNHKFPDGKSIKEVMIYDHNGTRGNQKLILADSGRMYTIKNERYLVLELFDGKSYHDKVAVSDGNYSNEKFVRSKFDKSQVVFSLSSFDMKQTDDRLFEKHRYMRNTQELWADIDSLQISNDQNREKVIQNLKNNYRYHLKEEKDEFMSDEDLKNLPEHVRKEKLAERKAKDSSNLQRKRPNSSKARIISRDSSLQKPANKKEKKPQNQDLRISKSVSESRSKKDSLRLSSPKTEEEKKNLALLINKTNKTSRVDRRKLKVRDNLRNNPKPTAQQVHTRALNQARSIKSFFESRVENIKANAKQTREFRVELYKKFTLAFACISMFLIGAPLGAIIKKGGLGVPILISIIFFILFYVISLTGEKWVKEGFVSPIPGMWMSNFILVLFGLFFLRQARNDSRLFETDLYLVWIDQIKTYFQKKAKA